MPEGAAPDTKNRSFTVTVEVEIPGAGAEGVLITQGGRFGGWGLLLVESKPEFAYAFSNQSQHKYRVASGEKRGPGKHAIHFDFKYDGPGYGGSGTGTLSVDGKQVAQDKIERTIPVRFSLDETLDIAADTGTPVVEDYVENMPFEFTAVLNKVVIARSSEKEPVSRYCACAARTASPSRSCPPSSISCSSALWSSWAGSFRLRRSGQRPRPRPCSSALRSSSAASRRRGNESSRSSSRERCFC